MTKKELLNAVSDLDDNYQIFVYSDKGTQFLPLGGVRVCPGGEIVITAGGFNIHDPLPPFDDMKFFQSYGDEKFVTLLPVGHPLLENPNRQDPPAVWPDWIERLQDKFEQVANEVMEEHSDLLSRLS